jgi:hypothetical protein
MDVIREHLVYKNGPLEICMSKITPQEQYEVIRILLESKPKQVAICTHESTNAYIDILLKKMNIRFIQCWKEEKLHQTFDLHKVCSSLPQ